MTGAPAQIASLRQSGGRGWLGATLIYAWAQLLWRPARRAVATRAALAYLADYCPRQRRWP